MADHDNENLGALVYALAMIGELSARVEALRVALQHVIRPEEYQRALAAAQREATARLEAETTSFLDGHQAAQMLKILEDFDGEPH